jgi:hypothetical protein
MPLSCPSHPWLLSPNLRLPLLLQNRSGRAYNQITVHPSDIQKTASTPFGIWDFPFMSFGLRNAAQTFQWFMKDTLRELDYCFAYLHDILVSSPSLEEHEQHLRTLKRRNLITPAKCVFKASPSLVAHFLKRVPNRWRNEWPIFRTALHPRQLTSFVA